MLDQGAVTSIYTRCGEGFALAALIAAGALAAGALSVSGAAVATIEGALVFGFGGVALAAAMVAFFASGSVLSRLGGKAAEEIRSRSAKGGRRDAVQVLANGAIATACAVTSVLAQSRGPGHAPAADPWLAAAVGALAAAAGDTWSTEIGALVRGPVRSILTLQTVSAGTSGGVSLGGTLAAPLGGASIGLIGAWLADPHAWVWVPIGFIAGLGGSAFDSLLGASAQALWRCEACGRLGEDRAHRCSGAPFSTPAGSLRLERGLAWIDNDAVNALATTLGAVLGYALAFL